MGNEVELISDGDGLAVLGDRDAVSSFLKTLGSPPNQELDVPRLSKLVGTGAAGLQAHAARAASAPLPHAGNWVRLTDESIKNIEKLGGLMPTDKPGISHAMIGKAGASKKWIQIDKGPGQLPANPTLLAGAPALMAQLAMQQAMNEITDYLAVIDAKLDDVLRAQKDSVLARVIGVGLQIDDAMKLRDHVGRVNDVTWSKVQDGSGVVAEAQAYALLQLDALAEKLEKKSTIADLMKTADEAESKTVEWLAVLARTFQLLDGLSVIELDRVMESSPDDLAGHRSGVQAARQERLDAIEATTARLVGRIQSAAERANSRVLFNPRQSPSVVQASSNVTSSVASFHERVGIGAAHLTTEARSWRSAAADVGRGARERGTIALATGKQMGAGARALASSASDKASTRFADRTRFRRKSASQKPKASE